MPTKLNVTWNAYIRSSLKMLKKNGGFFLPLLKLPDNFYHFSFLQEPVQSKNGVWCHILAGAARFLLSNLDRVQKCLRGLLGDGLFPLYSPFLTDGTLLTSRYSNLYFHGRRSWEPSQSVATRDTRFRRSCLFSVHDWLGRRCSRSSLLFAPVELHSLIPPLLNFRVRNRYATYTQLTLPLIPFVIHWWRKLPLREFVSL